MVKFKSCTSDQKFMVKSQDSLGITASQNTKPLTAQL